MPRTPNIRPLLTYGILSIASISFTYAVTTAYKSPAIVQILAALVSTYLTCRTVITMRRLNKSIYKD